MDDDVREWLLDGDPAVRWRVLRDLTGAGDDEVARERGRVAAQGWGARLLAEQRDDGGWGEGVYSPKWTSTTYTLLHLLWLGLPERHDAALRGCERLWAWQRGWRVPETCIAGIVVRLTSAFRYDADRLDGLVEHLAGEQLDDGGWNCKSHGNRAMHGSFHTSIQALEALDAYRRAGGTVGVDAAIGRGHAFFLRHRLYRSHRTGAVAIPASTKFPAFPEWHFDVLRGLEHFADAGERDERLADAIEVVRRARRRDGRWSTYTGYAGKQFFRLEEPGASRWNTARALRVMRWWEAS
ncbi:hypothetical protein ODJ79_20040 [Actinoplanes sp. KI2]|uniref:hypothetical protein n=1 Tax=Actinoplanes sp. KI2 TaxID=2983315 RepID=UPI0021D5B467|nr:hypothetical protein [Actinoplanes sp. KI2]MCU7726022.1 hypothetical protein [Actinoplanes sp. KI2]